MKENELMTINNIITTVNEFNAQISNISDLEIKKTAELMKVILQSLKEEASRLSSIRTSNQKTIDAINSIVNKS